MRRRFVLLRVAGFGLLAQATTIAGGLISASGEKPGEPVWSVSLQGGYASTFQLMLGGTFGAGPDFRTS